MHINKLKAYADSLKSYFNPILCDLCLHVIMNMASKSISALCHLL